MTINLKGRLLDMSRPLVMGIINATPDSFFSGSRLIDGGAMADADIAEAALAMAVRHISEGADILDVGACSTRPASIPVTEEEELRRLDSVLPAIREAYPEAVISLDTFRASVVRHCADRYDIDIVNDVSAGRVDTEMFATVAARRLPYVLMHGYARHTDATAAAPHERCTPAALLRFFAEKLLELRELGVADVILDPGIGFGKSSEESFAILEALPRLIAAMPEEPWLIALSRKSIVWQTLGTTPDDALNGTTVLNTIALQAGAHMIRVHDVQSAVQAVRLVAQIAKSPNP